jgi:hypothetical protein
MELVQVGNSTDATRQNLIYLTAADTNNPYIEGHSGVTTGVFTDTTRQFRLGNLTGITDATLSPSGYGLYAQNVFLSGKIVAFSGLIGGWSINSTYLAKDTGIESTSSGLAPNDYPFYAGATYINRSGAPTQITNTGYVISKYFIYKYNDVGNTTLVASDAEVSYANATPALKKAITLGPYIQGTKTLRIRFDLRISSALSTAYGQIYRNGSSVGTLQSTNSTSYVNFTEDIAGWAANDVIGLYINSDTGYFTAYADNFRLCGEHTTILNEITGTVTY